MRTNLPLTKRVGAAIAAIVAGVAFTACTATGTTTSSASAVSATSSSAAELLADNVESHADANDADYDAADAVAIKLADGASAADSAAVSIKGDVITISAPGTYVLSGSLSNGQIVVNSTDEGKVKLVLDGAEITNTSGSAVVITEADEAVLILADGSSNSVTDGKGYDTTATDAPDAAIFSMADLTIGGTGSLQVSGNTGDGIASKDGLVILNGKISVTAADDALRGKDYLIVADGTIEATATEDGLKSNNEDDDTVGYIAIQGGTVTVKAGDDGLHAEGDLSITGGNLTVAESVEAIEGANIIITGGAVDATSSDDGLNATSGTTSSEGGGGMQSDGSLLSIGGGTVLVNAEGDGLDSNGALEVSGGTTVVSGPTNGGNGSLDSNGGITVTGGTLVAAGSAGMAETPEAESGQGWVAVTLDSQLEAGQTISIVKDGKVIAAYTTVKTIGSFIVSDADITSGESYDVYVGGKLSGEAIGTYSESANIDGATKSTSVTANEGASTGMGGPGGGGGGRGPGAAPSSGS